MIQLFRNPLLSKNNKFWFLQKKFVKNSVLQPMFGWNFSIQVLLKMFKTFSSLYLIFDKRREKKPQQQQHVSLAHCTKRRSWVPPPPPGTHLPKYYLSTRPGTNMYFIFIFIFIFFFLILVCAPHWAEGKGYFLDAFPLPTVDLAIYHFELWNVAHLC